MDEHQRELYLSSLFFPRFERRPLTPDAQRFVDRMRLRYPNECSELDKQVDREFAESAIPNGGANPTLLSV